MSMAMLRKHYQLFFRNKLFRNTIICLCLALLFFSILFLKNDADFSFLFYLLIRFNYYFMLVLGSVIFLYFKEDKDSGLFECLNVIDNKQNRFLKYDFIVVFSILIVFNIFLLIILFGAAVINDEIYLYTTCIGQYYFMNVVLAQIVVMIIACLSSKINDSKLSLLCFVISMILSSPYMEWIEWTSKPMIPIDQVINFIIKPFSYFYQNGNWSIDHLYGFQNEIYKISILIFWSILTIFIIFYYKIKQILKTKLSIILIGITMLIAFSTIYIPQSTCRMNRKWDDTYSDLYYYGVMDNKTVYKPEKKIDYNIDQYALDISIRERLYVSGSISLTSKNSKDEFLLTLYHGYKVNKIKSKNLEYFSQDGDYITLKFSHEIKNADIQIEYNGYHPNFYSNYQAVQLPRYFPWYPMAGEKQIYFTFGDSSVANYGYNPYNRSQANYKIKIDANYPIITNLKRNKNGYYEDDSDSLTIIGGNTIEDTDKFVNYFPLYFTNEIDYEKYNKMRNENWNDIENKISEIFNVNLKNRNKKIIVMSNGIGRISNIGNYAEFDDYIIIGNDGFISDTDYLMYYLFRDTKINQSIKDNIVLLGVLNNTRESLYMQILDNIKNENNNNKLIDRLNNTNIDDFFEKIGSTIVWE